MSVKKTHTKNRSIRREKLSRNLAQQNLLDFLSCQCVLVRLPQLADPSHDIFDIDLYLYIYENVCVCVCLSVHVFLGRLEANWDTLWHKVAFRPRMGSKS